MPSNIGCLLLETFQSSKNTPLHSVHLGNEGHMRLPIGRAVLHELTLVSYHILSMDGKAPNNEKICSRKRPKAQEIVHHSQHLPTDISSNLP